MDTQRRRIMQAGLLAAAAGIGDVAAETCTAASREPSRPALKILVLGGTGFIGPHMVREALRRGHRVSLFNRGRSNNDLFPDLERLKGDRDGQLDALKGHRWDVVIDNSGYVPRHVANSARLLSSAAGHYLFISSISAYASFAVANTEDSLLASMPDESIEEVTGDTYGPMKALAEQRAAQEFGADRLTILRPTYVCGPGDRTDRYTYWLARTMRGGRMLWPGTPRDPLQIIDARDLANFTIDCAEQRITGIYNTVTPPGSFTVGDLLEDSLAVTNADMTPVWASSSFLRAQEAVQSMPIWTAPDSEDANSVMVSGELAYAQGLKNRPTRETARDTAAWWRTLPVGRRTKLRAGPSPEQEAEWLEAIPSSKQTG